MAHEDLLRVGSDVEVLAPLELRQRIAETIDRMRALYAA